MPRVAQVYLFTNRNCIFYDEMGEQIGEYQALVSWKPLPAYELTQLEELIRQLMTDKPQIFMARWPGPSDNSWAHPITLDEFASLLGLGPWYAKNKEIPNA